MSMQMNAIEEMVVFEITDEILEKINKCNVAAWTHSSFGIC